MPLMWLAWDHCRRAPAVSSSCVREGPAAPASAHGQVGSLQNAEVLNPFPVMLNKDLTHMVMLI